MAVRGREEEGRAHVFDGVVAGHRLVLHGRSHLLVLLGDQQLALGQRGGRRGFGDRGGGGGGGGCLLEDVLVDLLLLLECLDEGCL